MGQSLPLEGSIQSRVRERDVRGREGGSMVLGQAAVHFLIPFFVWALTAFVAGAVAWFAFAFELVSRAVRQLQHNYGRWKDAGLSPACFMLQLVLWHLKRWHMMMISALDCMDTMLVNMAHNQCPAECRQVGPQAGSQLSLSLPLALTLINC